VDKEKNLQSSCEYDGTGNREHSPAGGEDAFMREAYVVIEGSSHSARFKTQCTNSRGILGLNSISSVVWHRKFYTIEG
jgi:hypothetical protein